MASRSSKRPAQRKRARATEVLIDLTRVSGARLQSELRKGGARATAANTEILRRALAKEQRRAVRAPAETRKSTTSKGKKKKPASTRKSASKAKKKKKPAASARSERAAERLREKKREKKRRSDSAKKGHATRRRMQVERIVPSDLQAEVRRRSGVMAPDGRNAAHITITTGGHPADLLALQDELLGGAGETGLLRRRRGRRIWIQIYVETNVIGRGRYAGIQSMPVRRSITKRGAWTPTIPRERARRDFAGALATAEILTASGNEVVGFKVRIRVEE